MVADVKRKLREKLEQRISECVNRNESRTSLADCFFSQNSTCEITRKAFEELKEELLSEYPGIKVGDIGHSYSSGNIDYPATTTYSMEIDWRGVR